MRFRDHQDAAQASSRQLLWAFALAIVLLVLAVNGAMALAYRLLFYSGDWPRYFFATNTLLTLMYVLGGWWLESIHLRRGGAHVAELAGGRLLTTPGDLREQRLRNIVDELSIAANMPRPQAYVLDREDAINAFAAGWNHDDAVVAVTRGALERLERHELQGVVAHEFSHIQHGDIRLNMQMMGMVWGIEMLYHYGAALTQPIDARRGRGIWALFGFALMSVGWLGVLAGRVIKAAVSRQREHLADASAVKYTRQVDGIGGALRKAYDQQRRHVAELRNLQTEAMSHMLLVSGIGGRWLATHPTLPQRLERLYGRPITAMPAAVVAMGSAQQETSLAQESAQRLGLLPTAGGELHRHHPAAPQARAPTAQPIHAPANPYGVDWPVATATRSPAASAAPAAADASIDPEEERRALTRLQLAQGPGQQRAGLLACLLPGDTQQVSAAHAHWQAQLADVPSAAQVLSDIQTLSPGLRMGWFETQLGLSAGAPLAHREAILDGARRLIRADGRIAPLERAMFLLMRERLGMAPPMARRAGMAIASGEEITRAADAIGLITAWIAQGALPTDQRQGWVSQVWRALELPGEAPQSLEPSGDAIVSALFAVGELSWMQRPRIMRVWVEAVLQAGAGGPASLSLLFCICRLMDIPSPPGLSSFYSRPGTSVSNPTDNHKEKFA